MKQTTEITLQEDDGSESFLFSEEGLMPLNVGDKFYFSMRGTSPRSEEIYRANNQRFKDEFIDGFIESINNTCEKNHILYLEVLSISNSLSKEYTLSIDTPEVKFVKHYTVKEI